MFIDLARRGLLIAYSHIFVLSSYSKLKKNANSDAETLRDLPSDKEITFSLSSMDNISCGDILPNFLL